MYDDYEFNYEFNNESYTYDLVEMCEHHMACSQSSMRDEYETYNDDDEYTRDSCDYNELAYRHYAWYNEHISHEIHMYTQTRKRMVSVTLDIECYDDFPLEDLDWKDLPGLEGDEKVDISIKDLADIF